MGVREVGEKEISMRRDQYPFKVRRNLVDFLFFVLCAEQEHIGANAIRRTPCTSMDVGLVLMKKHTPQASDNAP